MKTATTIVATSAIALAGAFFCAGPISAQSAAKNPVSREGVTISNDVISITQSPAAGGAVVSFKLDGTEFIDVHDLGRLMQCSSYARSGWTTFTTDGYTFKTSDRPVINPNQAGDALKKASKILYVKKLDSTTLESKSIPREWFTHNWTGLDAHGGAQFDTGRFINTISILPGYSGRVAKLDYKLNPPVAGAWRTEVPALYLLAAYDKFYGVDTVNDAMPALTTQGIKATSYRPVSEIGGIIASNSRNGKTIGIYGAYETKGGAIGSKFVCYNFGGTVCTKLGTETSIRTLAAGQTETYTTYIVTGTSPLDVKNRMVELYKAGVR